MLNIIEHSSGASVASGIFADDEYRHFPPGHQFAVTDARTGKAGMVEVTASSPAEVHVRWLDAAKTKRGRSTR